VAADERIEKRSWIVSGVHVKEMSIQSK